MSGFDNGVLYAKNVNFSGVTPIFPTMVADGDLLIGSTTPNAGGTTINVGNIVSLSPSITIGYSSPDITIDFSGSSSAIDSISVDTSSGSGTNPVVPDGAGNIDVTGGQVAASTVGTNVIRTISTNPNEYTIQIQRATTNATTDVTLNGVSHFSSTNFTVDANGFVTTNNVFANITTPGAYPYTALTTDAVILVDTSVARTINLEATPTAGRWHIIKDNVGSAGANAITISPNAGNIDGAASTTINVAYGSVTLVYNGTQWNII